MCEEKGVFCGGPAQVGGYYRMAQVSFLLFCFFISAVSVMVLWWCDLGRRDPSLLFCLFVVAAVL